MLIDEARIVRARDFLRAIVDSYERCGATHPMNPAWRANCVALDLLEFVLGEPETMFEQKVERLFVAGNLSPESCLSYQKTRKEKVTDHVDI